MKLQPLCGVKLNYPLANRYNLADLMFLFEVDLSLIFNRLCCNPNKTFISIFISILYFLWLAQ